MGYFTDTVAAALAGRTVRRATLVLFDFADGPVRVWAGFGDLAAGGHVWQGLGEVGSIEGLQLALGGTAPETTFTLSGVRPDLVAETRASAENVADRDVTVFLQFLDADLQVLDDPVAIYLGQMDVMRIKRTGATRTIEVTAEAPFARRAMPPWGYLSDRDQNRLFPGDRGLEMVSLMGSKSVVWPPAFEAS